MYAAVRRITKQRYVKIHAGNAWANALLKKRLSYYIRQKPLKSWIAMAFVGRLHRLGPSIHAKVRRLLQELSHNI
jgi:hypothetical protein